AARSSSVNPLDALPVVPLVGFGVPFASASLPVAFFSDISASFPAAFPRRTRDYLDRPIIPKRAPRCNRPSRVGGGAPPGAACARGGPPVPGAAGPQLPVGTSPAAVPGRRAGEPGGRVRRRRPESPRAARHPSAPAPARWLAAVARTDC